MAFFAPGIQNVLKTAGMNFVPRGIILQKEFWIYDEINSFGPKHDFV
jgi:hypothetical protein